MRTPQVTHFLTVEKPSGFFDKDFAASKLRIFLCGISLQGFPPPPLLVDGI